MRIDRKKTIVCNNRWAKYATASAAGVFLGLGTQASADADFTFVDVGVQMIDRVPNYGYFDIFGPYTFGASGASLEFGHEIISYSNRGSLIVQGNGNMSIAGTGSTYGYFNYADNLAYGKFVSAVSSFGIVYGNMARGAGYSNSNFLNPGLSFVGFRFDLGNGTQYGFAEVIMDGPLFNTGFFVGYGYGDPGEAVYAGQREVPEPGTLGFLALGSVGLFAWRRKRSISVYE